MMIACVFCTCSRKNETKTAAANVEAVQNARAVVSILPASLEREIDLIEFFQRLDQFAELERAGTWIQGMALAESGIRENAGDYAGAIAAAYKELSWAWGLGLIEKHEVENGLLNVLAAKNEDDVIAVTNALLAFLNGQWDNAAAGLAPFFDDNDEPDSFGRWLLLVCALEKNGDDRRAGAAYRSIRARYAQYPEYWYRGARAFSGIIAAEFAENCINTAPQGPFADESRRIITEFVGLNSSDAPSIRTKREIDITVTLAVNSGNPQILDTLLPLLSLSDNPYTTYAVNTLRGLNSLAGFRDYFNRRALDSSGRLSERLFYIWRG